MRRRLTIAMALVHRPAVLFLDEPTAGLDVQSSILIRNMIRELHSGGATIFLTTHQMEEANQMCDRVAIINRGRIACVDAPERLRQAIEEVRSVEVSFEGGREELLQELGTLDGVIELRKDGDKLRLFTSDLGALIPLVVDAARRHGARLVSLNTLAPSLEDVFVKVTGLEVGSPAGGEGGEMA
jgi:ABC-2 type transport system ATP-binding protein